MTSPITTKLLVDPFSQVAIEIGGSKTLRIYFSSSLDNSLKNHRLICEKIQNIFPQSVLSNVFFEKSTPLYLKGDDTFINPDNNYLFTLNFDLNDGEGDLIKKIQKIPDAFKPQTGSSPLFRQNAMSFTPRELLHKTTLLSLIGELPFSLPSLEKVTDWLQVFLGPDCIKDMPYQSDPFIYPVSSKDAGAASAESSSIPAAAAASGDSVSGVKRPHCEMSTSEPAMMAIGGDGTGISFDDLKAKKRDHDTLDGFSKGILKVSGLTVSRPLFLQLNRNDFIALFTKNIPDIARSMLTGVFESENPNAASFIRMKLFISLLIISQLDSFSPDYFLNFIAAIEESIHSLTDTQKVWARAKFVSIAFFNSDFSCFYNKHSYVLIQRKPVIDYVLSAKLSCSSIDPLPISEGAYFEVLTAVINQLIPFAIISRLKPLTHFKQDLDWERRRHLLCARTSAAYDKALVL